MYNDRVKVNTRKVTRKSIREEKKGASEMKEVG